MLVDVKKRLHHEVLGLVGEALTELLELDKALGTLIQRLNILARCQLALLLDALFAHVLAHLILIGVGIVFTNLTDAGLCTGLRCREERLLDLEHFLFNAINSLNATNLSIDTNNSIKWYSCY